jgi:microcystin-dependent protein
VFARSSGDAYGSEFSASYMNGAGVSNSGGGQAHTNLMPSLAVNFIVALFGTYPSRN